MMMVVVTVMAAALHLIKSYGLTQHAVNLILVNTGLV